MFSYLYNEAAKLDFEPGILGAKAIGASKGKRICLVSDSSARMQPTAETTARWLAAAGWDVTWLDLFYHAAAPNDAAAPGEEMTGMTFHYDKVSNKYQQTNWYTPMQSLSAYHWLKQKSFDVILFQHGFGAAYFCCMAKSMGLAFTDTPIIAMCDDPYAFWLEKGEFFPTFIRTEAEIDHFERETVARADGVIFTNRDAFDWMVSGHWPLGDNPGRVAMLGDNDKQPWDKWLKSKIRKRATPALSADDISLSVCIASYNRPDYLRETLDALLKQTTKNFEVVVIDDGSTDPGVELLKEEMAPVFAKRGWIWHKQENQGLNASRNSGAKLAHGTHLLFKDDDNISTHDEIEIFTKAAQYTGADIVNCVMGKHYLSEDATNALAQFPSRPDSGLSSQPIFSIFNGAVTSIGMMYNSFGDANTVVRKSVYQALNGRTVNGDAFYEDWEFHVRAAIAGYKFVTVPEALYLYRVHPNSMTKNLHKIHRGWLAVLRVYAKEIPPFLYPLLLQAAAGNYHAWHYNVSPTRFPDDKLFPSIGNFVKTHPVFKNKPANDVPQIVMAATKKHIDQAAATLISLLTSSKSELNIHIVSALDAKGKNALKKVADHFDVKLKFIPYPPAKENRLPNSRNLDDGTHAMFWQLLLPKLLPRLERVITLESGVMVRCDIAELWQTDFGDSILAAGRDERHWFKVKGPKLRERGCFDSSVLLINLKQWQKAKITDHALQYVAKMENERDIKQLWAQLPLNHAIAGRWFLLSLKWNWPDDCAWENNSNPNADRLNGLTLDLREYNIIRTSPAICRFIGSVKPWSTTTRCTTALGREYLVYLKLAKTILSYNAADRLRKS